jgi:DNA-binding MarR family transcriptional regulator
MKQNTIANEAAVELQSVPQVLQEFSAELMKHSAGDMMHLLRRVELSMAQLVALLFLHRRGATSLGDIGKHLNLTLGATSHLVDRLVAGGLVTRVEDPGDRRQKQIALTDAGISVVTDAKQVRVEEMARRLAELPPELLNRLMSAMSDVVIYLRDHDLHPTDNSANSKH